MEKIMKKIMISKSVCLIITVLMAGTFFLSCKDKTSGPDPKFVAAVSGGVIGRREPLKVVFVKNQDISKPLGSNVFNLRPAVKG